MRRGKPLPCVIRINQYNPKEKKAQQKLFQCIDIIPERTSHTEIFLQKKREKRKKKYMNKLPCEMTFEYLPELPSLQDSYTK